MLIVSAFVEIYPSFAVKEAPFVAIIFVFVVISPELDVIVFKLVRIKPAFVTPA